MSARKIVNGFSSVSAQSAKTRLSLPANAIRVRKNGIEFRSADPIAVWKEMTVDLQSPRGKKIHCNGVVVACAGNRHTGYTVAMLFTNISRHAQEVLDSLLSSRLN
jgi:hypothetical protein